MISDHKKMGATFRRLIAAGVDVNATDHDGKNALYYAVQVNPYRFKHSPCVFGNIGLE